MIITDISDFEENGIYKVIYTNSYIYYFKFKCINNDGRLDFYWEICNNTFCKNYIMKVSFSFYEGIYEKVDISDIIEYLPDDNKDKIVYLRKQRIKKLLV